MTLASKTMIPIWLLGISLLLGGLTCVLWRLRIRPALRVPRGLISFAFVLTTTGALSFLTGGVFYVWYFYRPQPKPIKKVLFEGITYIRDVRRIPRPLVIHVIQVELDAPGLSFLVTPPDRSGGREMRAQTTGQFLARNKLQLAINGFAFSPAITNSLWHWYPHAGDPVDVAGYASSKGNVYSSPQAQEGTQLALNISADNQVSIGNAGPWYNTVSGWTLDLDVHSMHGRDMGEPAPRTSVAIDRLRQRLLIVVVDGRQPNYSEGLTLRELAAVVREYGGDEALNLDGGGSTTLVIEGSSGRPRVLNSPVHTLIPGRQRPVANHLGLFCRNL